jgi:hypothetical protein
VKGKKALLLALLALTSRALAEDAEQSRIMALEAAWNHAVQQRDGNAVNALLSSELIYIGHGGTVMDKAQYMETVRQTSLHAEQVFSESMKVQMYGKSAVVIGVYREKGTRKGKRYLLRERFVDTWVNRQSAWVCVSSQGTVITHQGLITH